MQQGGSEQRITSANSSPRMQHKSYSLFGLFTKRSTKVEPHPIDNSDDSNTKQKDDNHLHPTSNQRQEHDMSFAKCSPDKKPSTSIISNTVMTNHINNNVKVSNISGQTMLPNANLLNNNLNKSNSSNSSGGGGILSLQRRIKPPSKSKTHLHRHSTDGYQSDGGEIVFRKSPKHRSPNHNRFSHQFSLCCKAERKPLTPPVTVRYNSVADGNNALKRDNLSLSWSMVDDASISSDINNSNAAVATTSTAFLPLQQSAQQSTFGYKTLHECASAPQSPVTAKVMFNENTSHSSPSNSSVKSTQSDIPNGANSLYSAAIASTSAGAGGGPIRPIAVTACRSRLRLKLLPPGKEIPKQLPPFEGAPQPVVETMLRATTPQHMSSPNIASKPEVIIEQPDTDLRFMSHEDIKIRRQPPSQASGLATHALMAAQVLSLIPTEKARERSFLDGRLGSLSLMGPSELNRVIPSKEVTIFVGTWNMNGQSPPKQMNDFVLPTAIEHVPDIVVIGTQESSPDRFGWEVTIQETLGPTHVLFHSTALGTLHLAVYMRRDLIWYCSAPEDASMSVRTGSAFRTKGAVAISFCLFGTSMLFVTSHLTAHQQKVKERVSDVKRIINALDLPKNLQLRHKNKDVTQNFDNVFWCGDLNFRLSEPREKLLEWIQTTKFPLPSHLPHGYMHTDQLSSVLADGAAFRGFMEANITFPPTYKYDPGTQFFDTSTKQRAPAYTDRILYKYRQTQGLVMRRQSTVMGVSTPLQPYIQCLLYDSVPSIITSDHKPVLALFKVSIRAGTDSIPLAAGLFNRDIFLEGMKRRLNNQYSGSSAVCAIQ